MDRLKLITILLIIYLILAVSLAARAENPCSEMKKAELALIELSKSLKKEAARSYLRLDWNGTSVTGEEYDKMMETNQKHYKQDPNLRLVNP